MSKDPKSNEVTFDPEDWHEFQAMGYKMVDDIVDFLKEIRSRPVWTPVPEQVEKTFSTTLPQDPTSIAEVYREFKENVMPYQRGHQHPRYWAYVNGTGCPVGMFGAMLAAGMNAMSVGTGDASTHVELQVLNWFKEMLGYPMEAHGLLVSGGSEANLVGLAVGRHAKAEVLVKTQGLIGAPKKMIVYCSEQTHFSVIRGVEVLGLGRDAIRTISVNEQFQINTEELRDRIEEDRRAGHLPFCVVGTAGTTGTGAIDDLEALADIAKEHGLWFHVDGAIGAVAYLSPRMRSALKGMERADSLAFDLHKWMQVPYEVGCVLVRSADLQLSTFAYDASYINASKRDRSVSKNPLFIQAGVQLTRDFKALKVWMSFKTHGIDKYRKLVEQGMDQAQYLGDLVKRTPELELMAPVSLNVVCFRHTFPGVGEADLDALNKEIMTRLRAEGIATMSQEIFRGKFSLRVCTVNHRSRREDFDLLIREVLRMGRELTLSNREPKAG